MEKNILVSHFTGEMPEAETVQDWRALSQLLRVSLPTPCHEGCTHERPRLPHL